MKSLNLYRHLWLPLLIGFILVPIPLLGDLHIESALLAALIGCFWAGWKACRSATLVRDDRQRISSVLRVIYLAGCPLLLFGLLSGCFSWNGFGFWILYPMPSVLFGYAIGRFIRCTNISFRRTLTILILFWIAVGMFLIEFFSLPQVYFFNHVWGGWPGPIYDETIKVGWNLVGFRGLTLAWTALLWWLPSVKKSTKAKIITSICIIGLILGYLYLPEMGIISPRSYVQKQLGGVKKTPHFMIYYDEAHFSPEEIGLAAKEHEFYFHEISKKLDLAPRDTTHKIESYLYAHAWQKKELVGAKFTSYVPVWLKQDQLHIAKQQLAHSLKHELVHVLAKPFGAPIIHASWSIGLTEGLAVALAPDESPVSTINQIVRSEKPLPKVKVMEQSLSPLGFYLGRSAVNYTTTGSFVQYLMKHYPVKNLKRAYRTGNVAENYPVPFKKLIQGWHGALNTIAIDSTDRVEARTLFGFPSLFEQKCPHVQSKFEQHWDHYRYFLLDGDTTRALQQLDAAWKSSNGNVLVKNKWTFWKLKSHHSKQVESKASLQENSTEALLLYADAFKMNDQPDSAYSYLAEAEHRQSLHPDSSLALALQTRLDDKQWRYYRQLTYKNKLPDITTFQQFMYRTKIRTLGKAMELKKWKRMAMYAHQLLTEPATVHYFDTYIQTLRRLGYLGKIVDAKAWIQKLDMLPLRARQRERLQEKTRWIHFMETHPQ